MGLVLGTAAILVLVLVGVGAASAQTSNTEAASPYDQFVSRVAQLLGKTPAQLEAMMTRASTEQIDRAVADGDLTQEQADAIKERIAESGRPFPMFGHPRGGRFGQHRGIVGEVTHVNGTTLTVETAAGNKTVNLTADTRIRENGEEAQASAIQAGDTVRVRGEANDAGVVTAEAVLIGDLGGRRHHHGPWGGRAPDDDDPADGH